MKRYSEEERPVGYGKCYDCGLDYDDFPGDLIVNNELWLIISPTDRSGGGLLCANCLLSRLREMGLGCMRLEVGTVICIEDAKKKLEEEQKLGFEDG